MALFALRHRAGTLTYTAAALVRGSSISPLSVVSQVRQFSEKMSLPRVFFDVSADGQALGRIVMEVRYKQVYYTRFLRFPARGLVRHLPTGFSFLQVIANSRIIRM